MSSSHNPHYDDAPAEVEEDDAMLDPNEADEEILEDPDAAMDSGSDGEDGQEGDEEIQLQNDSAAHFDLHNDSIFCIAQHPVHSSIVATGGGDDVGYVFDNTPPVREQPVLPASYESSPQTGQPEARESISPLFKIEGHNDSLNALAFTLPRGEYLVSAGLDGQLRAYHDKSSTGKSWSFLSSAQEVPEINWLSASPSKEHPNAIALGGSDGSVWVYTIDVSETASPLTILQASCLHTAACTAGAWTPDGKMLVTVSEDSSFCAWDVFGEVSGEMGKAVVELRGEDQRFLVEGGLFSVGVAPSGTFAVAGGVGGMAKVVGLPKIGSESSAPVTGKKGGKKGGVAAAGAASSSGAGRQTGQILASLQAQTDGIESVAFSPAPLNLLALGSVDGSIALFDAAHRFAVRRHIKNAHEEHAVVKVEFVQDARSGGSILTSCGMDGVVRRWDTRGGTAAAGQGLVGEWRGHRGGGEGGGVLGFVQGGGGGRIVTAGDDGIALVFETPIAL